MNIFGGRVDINCRLKKNRFVDNIRGERATVEHD